MTCHNCECPICTRERAARDMLKALKLTLNRLGELDRDDEAGIRIVIAKAIANAEDVS